jgi:excisionase family DNA binding protein
LSATAAAPRKDLLKPEQVAARWGVPVSHVWRLAREGKVPHVKLGRYVRFHPDALDEWERSGGRGV